MKNSSNFPLADSDADAPSAQVAETAISMFPNPSGKPDLISFVSPAAIVEIVSEALFPIRTKPSRFILH